MEMEIQISFDKTSEFQGGGGCLNTPNPPWFATAYNLGQRFSNFFQVGTTFISQNVLRTALLLSA
jgi:hypothetical protein